MDDIQDAVTDYQVSTNPIWFLFTSSFKRKWLDGEPADYIQSKSQTDCESLKWIGLNVPDSSVGSRLDFLQMEVKMS